MNQWERAARGARAAQGAQGARGARADQPGSAAARGASIMVLVSFFESIFSLSVRHVIDETLRHVNCKLFTAYINRIIYNLF